MRSILILIGGSLMTLAAFAHALLGWRGVRAELVDAGANLELMSDVSAGWFFGSAAMLTFGLIVLVSGLRLKKNDFSGVYAIRLAAACYLLFGLAAFLFQDFNRHFLGFIVMGLLTGGPTLGRGGRTHS